MTTRTSKTTKTTAIPTTQNEDWGFWGTMENRAAAAWPLAMTAIAQATGESLDATRVFLDSRYGRHFADNVQDNLDAGRSMKSAIEAATARWMGWKISSTTSREYGIPKGLPYLTGFVMHVNIEADAA